MGKSRQLSYANEKSVSSCKRVKGGRLREVQLYNISDK